MNSEDKWLDEILDNYMEVDTNSSAYGAAVVHFKKITKQAILSHYEQRMQEEVRKGSYRYRSDIAHAIGYCQGLGHPDEYLEKQYPDILKSAGDK